MTEFYIDGFSALLGDAPAEDFAPYVDVRLNSLHELLGALEEKE